jgi:NitT/TauT family transport system ATP-binding protein
MISSALRLAIRGIDFEDASGDHSRPLVGPIQLDIQEGEFVSLVGPPRSGKTVLLKMIAGILSPSHGEISYFLADPQTVGRRIGLALQDPALLPWRSAIQNIMLHAEILGLDLDQCRNRARRLMAWFGFSRYEDCKPHELPPEVKPAVSICRALIHSPALLLLDDPFQGVDAMSLEPMLDSLQRLWLETANTAVLCTSDLLQAVLLSDRIAILSPAPGRILECITVGLPRPRRNDRATAPQVAEYCHYLRMHFRAQGILN